MKYKGLSPDQKHYYVYLFFFQGMADELYLKVGKSASLRTRLIDLTKGNPTKLYRSYVMDVGSFKEDADGIEYIFKRRLSPLNIHGEWFKVSYQTLNFLRYIMNIINISQHYDEEVWCVNSFGEYFSKMGHRSEKGFPFEYDWDEVFRHENNYKFQPIEFLDENEIFIDHEIEFSEIMDTISEYIKNSTYEFPDEYVDLEPDFDFRDFFTSDECGKERKDWWNYRLPYRDIVEME